jgi:hypothetical protein
MKNPKIMEWKSNHTTKISSHIECDKTFSNLVARRELMTMVFVPNTLLGCYLGVES